MRGQGEIFSLAVSLPVGILNGVMHSGDTANLRPVAQFA